MALTHGKLPLHWGYRCESPALFTRCWESNLQLWASGKHSTTTPQPHPQMKSLTNETAYHIYFKWAMMSQRTPHLQEIWVKSSSSISKSTKVFLWKGKFIVKAEAMKNIVGVLDLPVCPSVPCHPWQPNSAEQPGSFTLHAQRNGSSNMNLGDFSKGGRALLGIHFF